MGTRGGIIGEPRNSKSKLGHKTCYSAEIIGELDLDRQNVFSIASFRPRQKHEFSPDRRNFSNASRRFRTLLILRGLGVAPQVLSGEVYTSTVHRKRPRQSGIWGTFGASRLPCASLARLLKGLPNTSCAHLGLWDAPSLHISKVETRCGRASLRVYLRKCKSRDAST